LQGAIDAEAEAREAAVTQEAQARGAADTALQGAIDAEAEAREAAVTQEAQARGAADTALQGAIDAEAEAREAAVTQEAQARDAAIAAAQLDTQKWLSAVETKAELPDPTSLERTVGYLCRVMKDPDAANTGVWQLVAGADEWSFFSDNLDFVDETELQAAVAAEAALREAAEAALQGSIDAEAQARDGADTALQNAIDAEAEARDAAIAGAVVTTLEDQDASPVLPPVTETPLSELLQKTRNTLKYLRDFGGGGGGAETGEVLPPFFADRDGRLVSARGGTLIELNVTEQPEQQINEE
jgi:hypothetical protein